MAHAKPRGSILSAAQQSQKDARPNPDKWFLSLPKDDQQQLCDAVAVHFQDGTVTLAAIYRVACDRYGLTFGRYKFSRWANLQWESISAKQKNR